MLRVIIKGINYAVQLNKKTVAIITPEGAMEYFNSKAARFMDIQEVMSDNTDVWVETPEAVDLSNTKDWRKEAKKERQQDYAKALLVFNQA